MEYPIHPEISNHRFSIPGGNLAAVTVLLAGQRPAVRFALQRPGDIVVVGEVASTWDVFGEIAGRTPEVVVLDPHQVGAPAAEKVIERVAARTKVLVLTEIDDDAAIRRAFRAGALGYLIADADHDQVLGGVRVVASGGLIVGKSIARRFAALIYTGRAPYPFPQLTAREQEVLERIAAGKSNLAIARELTLAPKTIGNRVSAVFAKLGVANRAQAIVLARDAGLGRD